VYFYPILYQHGPDVNLIGIVARVNNLMSAHFGRSFGSDIFLSSNSHPLIVPIDCPDPSGKWRWL